MRFPTASRQDEEGRAGLLSMMAHDVADIDPRLLAMAAKRWALERPFIPKSSELANLCREIEKQCAWADRSQQLAPPAKAAEPPRVSNPLTRDELQQLVDASSDSVSRSALKMGIDNGFIDSLGAGQYRESGGSIIVTRSQRIDIAA